jgi:G3E family GTPase
MIRFDNGCVCCSVSGDLVSQLTDLLEGPSCPEHVLVETSGVSDPGRLLVALRDPYLRRLARVDGVITLVDAANADAVPAAMQELARRQLAAADVIVLNKADLVSAEQLATVRERLTYPAARVVETAHAEIPLALVLGVAGAGRVREGGGEGTPSDHTDRFATWAWTSSRPLALDAVRRALSSLPPQIYRAKGFLLLAEAPESRVVAHVVGRRVEIRPLGPWDGAIPRTELVFVSLAGGIDTADLRGRLIGTVAPDGRRSAGEGERPAPHAARPHEEVEPVRM